MNRPRLLVPLLFLLFATSHAHAEQQTHVVYAGQRLGSIAKRYNVTVEDISRANGIRSTDPIRPGQRLIIPSKDDKGARASRAKAAPPKTNDDLPAAERTHRVASGQRLESIARRYKVTVDAICSANGIGRKSVIRPGQTLVIPEPGGSSSSARAAAPATGYRAYVRAPRQKGRVELVSYSQRFRGHVFDKRGKLLPAAAAGISRVLAATGERPDPDRRLIQLLVKVSDTFGGRPIRIVSGYRTTSYYDDSRHKMSRAIDFSIPGVPNEAIRDYLRTLRNVGVGYYPNSSFVHLDVREYAAYWVDYSGPGEAPRRTMLARRTTRPERDEPVRPSGEETPGAERTTLPATGTSPLIGLGESSTGRNPSLGESLRTLSIPHARPGARAQ